MTREITFHRSNGKKWLVVARWTDQTQTLVNRSPYQSHHINIVLAIIFCQKKELMVWCGGTDYLKGISWSEWFRIFEEWFLILLSAAEISFYAVDRDRYNLFKYRIPTRTTTEIQLIISNIIDCITFTMQALNNDCLPRNNAFSERQKQPCHFNVFSFPAKIQSLLKITFWKVQITYWKTSFNVKMFRQEKKVIVWIWNSIFESKLAPKKER